MEKNEKMDAKRLKLLKAAIVKLRELKNLIDQINIESATNYDCRVLGFRYDNYPISGNTKVTIHLDSLTSLNQMFKEVKKGKPTEYYETFQHQSGDITAFCLVEKEAKNDESVSAK